MKKTYLKYSIILLGFLLITNLFTYGVASLEYYEEYYEEYADHDTRIHKDNPNTNYDSYNSVRIQCSSDGNISNGMIGLWNFTVNTIPNNSIITSAKFYAYAHTREGNGADLSIMRITSNWNNNTVTWNTKPSWNGFYFDTITCFTAPSWYNWNITDLVKGWVNETYDNYGFYMDGDAQYHGMWFSSLENSSHPYLNVTYELPYPIISTKLRENPALNGIEQAIVGVMGVVILIGFLYIVMKTNYKKEGALAKLLVGIMIALSLLTIIYSVL